MKTKCSNCQKVLSVPDNYKGKQIKCISCHKVVVAEPITETAKLQVSEQSAPPTSHRNQWIMAIIISVGLAWLIGFVCGVVVMRPDRDTTKSPGAITNAEENTRIPEITRLTTEAATKRGKYTSEGKAGTTGTTGNVVMPKYTVLNEDIHDGPLKAQVVLNVLVSGEISEVSLRALLKGLYSSAKARRGFKYHSTPTNIYIYAFTSKERAESGIGQWIAMLDESPGDTSPSISINKRQIAQLGAKPEEKFGLSENRRRQIFYELVMAGDNAETLAIQKYPNDIMKQIDYENKIREANEQKVREKYNITKQQMYKIKGEGVTEDWPLPK